MPSVPALTAAAATTTTTSTTIALRPTTTSQPRQKRRHRSRQFKYLQKYCVPSSPTKPTPASRISARSLLPISPPPAVSPSSALTPVHSKPPHVDRISVLIVDDNQVNLSVMKRVLKIHMAETIQHMEMVKSGVRALELLHQRVFDLILLDIDMPVLNGVDTARHIRASTEYNILNQNRDIPIIAVTTNDSPEWKRQYAKVGINGCISKPVVAALLKQILTQVLTNGSSPESLMV